MKPVKAWYFSDATKKLLHGDGRGIAIGVTHEVKGELKLCVTGLHASKKLIDALLYAPGSVVWQVELSGKILKGDNKMCASKRTYLAGGIDISKVLRKFARLQALSVIDKWDCPDIVRKWLETGDESIRSAAKSAAGLTAEAAAEAAAESAAWSAAESAAWAAAWAATWSAAKLTTRSSVKLTAESAAKLTAESAAWAAANKMLLKMVTEAIMGGKK